MSNQQKVLVGVSFVLAFALASSGCARKAAEAPPTPPPAPTTTTPAPTPPTPPPPTPAPQETPPTPVVELQDAFFDFDSYALREDARTVLDQDSRLLRDNSGASVLIEGHCDERGTVEYNLALGEKRANAAKDYLVGAGISASRIETVSYGKERPFDPGHDEAAWAKNRRAHFVRK
jgi:peptidoglycan-associated lipoprotein